MTPYSLLAFLRLLCLSAILNFTSKPYIVKLEEKVTCLLLTIFSISGSKNGEDIFIANDGKRHDGVQGHTMSHISHAVKTKQLTEAI